MFCDRAKEFLRESGVGFEDRDVSADPAVFGELQALGVMTTPVLLIEGEIVIGFDKARIQRLLDSPPGTT